MSARGTGQQRREVRPAVRPVMEVTAVEVTPVSAVRRGGRSPYLEDQRDSDYERAMREALRFRDGATPYGDPAPPVSRDRKPPKRRREPEPTPAAQAAPDDPDQSVEPQVPGLGTEVDTYI